MLQKKEEMETNDSLTKRSRFIALQHEAGWRLKQQLEMTSHSLGFSSKFDQLQKKKKRRQGELPNHLVVENYCMVSLVREQWRLIFVC